MSKLVQYSFDPANPPKLTEAQKEELRRLAVDPEVALGLLLAAGISLSSGRLG